MEIIKPGVIPVPAKYTGKCIKCRCEFRCNQNDFVHPRPKVDQWNTAPLVHMVPYVECPTCGNRIYTGHLDREE